MRIQSRKDIENFVNWLVKQKDVNFHPDTPFIDYATPVGDQFFSGKQCLELERTLAKCRDFCKANHLDLYEIAINPLRQRLKID